MNFSGARTIAGGRGWLSLTPASFRDAVLERSQLVETDPGGVIYQVGDAPGGLYGLLSGSLGISIAPGENGPYLAHFAQPGTWFGEGAVITGRPRQVGLTATSACQLLHLPLHSLNEILGNDPTAWRSVALLTTLHLDVAIGAADDLMIRGHLPRFVAILLRLGGCRSHGPTPEVSVEVHVSQSDLAHMANVGRTTANTMLRSLARAGHIEHSYRHIRILTPSAMRAMLRES